MALLDFPNNMGLNRSIPGNRKSPFVGFVTLRIIYLLFESPTFSNDQSEICYLGQSAHSAEVAIMQFDNCVKMIA